MSEPTRYRIADNQVQRVYGGNILVVDPAGPLVEYADYAALRMERIHDLNQIGGLQEENARLKAEVDNSNLINTELLVLSNQQASEVRRLQAEVERLRKAGDWMCGLLQFDFVTKDWNAAKEGKPQS